MDFDWRKSASMVVNCAVRGFAGLCGSCVCGGWEREKKGTKGTKGKKGKKGERRMFRKCVNHKDTSYMR